MPARLDDAQVLAALSRGGTTGGFDLERNHALIERVPEAMRLVHYTRDSVPAEYLASFGYYHDKIGNIHLDGLPVPMCREFQYGIWRIVELGGRVPCAPLGLLTRELAETSRLLEGRGLPATSVLNRGPQQWRAELSKTWRRRTGALPNANTLRTFAAPLDRVSKLVWFAYDQSPWWRREVWDPVLDKRIPLRDHEPFGTQATHWHRVEPQWLRLGAMWQVKTMLASDRMRWSTAHGRLHGLRRFGQFVVDEGIDHPVLCDDPEQLRPLMLRFLEQITTEPASSGQRRGKRRTYTSLSTITAAVRQFYAFMYDHRVEAAAQTGDPRWRELTPQHLRLWHPGDLPRKQRQRYDERHLFSDRVLSQILQRAHLLGDPREQAGFDDPQAMRLLLLLAATGRRISELVMLDAHPIIPVATSSDDLSEVAKLRYQQTKIDGAPDTIFVDQQVVEIVAEQQRWLRAHLAANGCADQSRYLFVKMQNNTRGQDHYSTARFRDQLQKLVDRTGLTDEDGSPLRLSVTHRFRHTKATSLLNAGVPLHVVQRYIGHTSPEMTMHYAQTLDATAKAEFLRYQKITRDGASAPMAADDLYDLMALDTRTDRVLPNGWCTLPPARSCDKGNACLTCDLFVTDRQFLDVHTTELDGLDHLIDQRQQAHQDRTGESMTENHVWLTLRRREQGALRTIIDTLQTEPTSCGSGATVRADHDALADPAQGRV